MNKPHLKIIISRKGEFSKLERIEFRGKLVTLYQLIPNGSVPSFRYLIENYNLEYAIE